MKTLSGGQFFQGFKASGNHLSRVFEEISGGERVVQKLVSYERCRVGVCFSKLRKSANDGMAKIDL